MQLDGITAQSSSLPLICVTFSAFWSHHCAMFELHTYSSWYQAEGYFCKRLFNKKHNFDACKSLVTNNKGTDHPAYQHNQLLRYSLSNIIKAYMEHMSNFYIIANL